MKDYNFKNSIIVSCQASEEEPLYGTEIMKKLALAALIGGAKGIRTNAPENVKAIKEVVNLPVIGIFKSHADKNSAFITVRKEEIRQLVEAGADLIAIDCTRRDRPEPLHELFAFTRSNYPNVGIVADIADIEDTRRVLKLRPDFISTTLSGYTEYTKDRPRPDIPLISEIRQITDIPILAEGNYYTPQQVREAILEGAYAVVVGTAITRPQIITKRFVNAISDLYRKDFTAVGIDIGGTWIRGVKISRYGKIVKKFKKTNPGHPEKIVSSVIDMIETLRDESTTHVGIATAGRVDTQSGIVIYATDNIKGWTGVNLRQIVGEKTGIFPLIDNDVNCAAYAQWKQTKEDPLMLIAIGTGVGGGIIVDGNILRGHQSMGGEVGHIVFPGNSKSCSCGKFGCIETMISGKVMRNDLKNLQGEKFKEKLEQFADYVAWLVDVIMHTIAPERIYLGGVAPKYGNTFLHMIRYALKKLSNLEYSPDIVTFTTLDEFAGALGAALLSLSQIPKD